MLQLYDMLSQFTSQLGGMDEVKTPAEIGLISLSGKVIGSYKIETYQKQKKDARQLLRERMRGK